MKKEVVEKNVDEYIDMGLFKKPKEAKPYLMDGYNLGSMEMLNRIADSINSTLKRIGNSNVARERITQTHSILCGLSERIGITDNEGDDFVERAFKGL